VAEIPALGEPAILDVPLEAPLPVEQFERSRPHDRARALVQVRLEPLDVFALPCDRELGLVGDGAARLGAQGIGRHWRSLAGIDPHVPLRVGKAVAYCRR
jgi:hypothetical protein